MTFTVTDDDVNADGSPRPIPGATVKVEGVVDGGGTVSGTSGGAGQVTLSFTPVSDTITVTATAPPNPDPLLRFNERVRGFGPLGPINQGTPAPVGAGGGVGGLCSGLENVLGLHVVGNAKANKLTGTAGRDVICGGGGDDVIHGLGGNDFIVGEDGNDTVAPGEGNDNAFGNEGVDLLDYGDVKAKVRVDLRSSLASGAGQDTIGGFQSARGGRGGDTLIGDDTPNRLLGGKGKDALSGLGGKDRLGGGPGKDRLKGGKGKDRLSGGPGRDTCKGGPGKDRATRCERS